MRNKNIRKIIPVIDYLEAHLTEKPDLERVANAAHYSKYHLHRMFADTVGLTIHEYLQRRQLTEAAKLLVFQINPFWTSPCWQDMTASRRLPIYLQSCTRCPQTNTGKMKNFTRCSLSLN